MEIDNLILLTLELNIKDHFEVALPQQFPTCKFSIIDSHPLSADSCKGMLKVEDGNVDEILIYIANTHKEIEAKKFSENIIEFKVRQCPLAELLTCMSCLERHPTILYGEYKRFQVIIRAADRSQVTTFLARRGIEVKKVTVSNLSKDFGPSLTQRQRRILDIAMDSGYYDFPRLITLQTLATQIGLAPSTLTVHLQRIEHKLIRHAAGELRF